MDYKRYNRQIILEEFGTQAQNKLHAAKVLVIGAGGLGCPALLYLAAAGVGCIGIVDFDVVELSNLQRQILYQQDYIGKPKAESAKNRLLTFNSELKVNVYNLKISNNNALDIINDYDIVIDGSDNFTTRYLVNDACVILDKPLVYGAVLKFEGQIGVFNAVDINTNLKLNYRHLFENVSFGDNSFSCSDVGVIGVLPGIIGTMQATEAIKLITNVGVPLSNKILCYNALNNVFFDFEISNKDQTNLFFPKTIEEYINFDYDKNCYVNFKNA